LNKTILNLKIQDFTPKSAKINGMTTKEDKELFKKEMRARGVTPLKKRHDRVLYKKSAPKIKNNSKSITSSHDEGTIELMLEAFVSCSPEEKLFFARPDLPIKTIRKLRQAKIEFEAKIDLHAMNIEEAKEALQQFLMYCQQQRIGAVLVIHGKGRAIIKSAVASWLQSYPQTLAFCSAQPKDGGAGAIYLLLKKKKGRR